MSTSDVKVECEGLHAAAALPHQHHIHESIAHGVNPMLVILTQQSAVLCMGIAMTHSGVRRMFRDCWWWCRTAMGGSTLYVEAARVETGEGKGHLRTTGPLWLIQASFLTSGAAQLMKQCEADSQSNTHHHHWLRPSSMLCRPARGSHEGERQHCAHLCAHTGRAHRRAAQLLRRLLHPRACAGRLHPKGRPFSRLHSHHSFAVTGA